MITPNWLLNGFILERAGDPSALLSRSMLARAGELHVGIGGGTPFLTLDSDFGSGQSFDFRYLRYPGPHWILPEAAGRIFDTAVWKLTFAYSGEGSDDIGGAWEETWQAGTFTRVLDGIGGRSVEVSNEPGWTSISDALAQTLYPLPPEGDDPPEYPSIFTLGGFSIQIAGEVGDEGEEVPARIEVECQVGEITPAFYAENPPYEPGRWNQEDLIPVWLVQSSFSAEAWIDGVRVSRTDIGYHGDAQVGVVGGDDGDWILVLSVEDAHDTP